MTPASLERLGFYLGRSGAHAGRALMLEDLTTLLAHIPAEAENSVYAKAILEENVLGKATVNNRDHASRRMRQLYALDGRVCLFRAFRRLWSQSGESRPVLAALMAMARDALFRSSADLVVSTAPGEPLTGQAIKKHLDNFAAGRLSDEVLKHASSNVLSSWSQSGHLDSGQQRLRRRANAGEAACAFALFLGWLEGARGQLLFKTSWTAVLDRPTDDLLTWATNASRRGMLELLNAGGVVEVRFPGYLTNEEKQLP